VTTHGISSIYSSDNHVPALFISVGKDSLVESFTFIFRFPLKSSSPKAALSIPDSVARVMEKKLGNWRYQIIVGGKRANQEAYPDSIITTEMLGDENKGINPYEYFKLDYLKKK
jgi:hypothetical protein